MPAVVPLLAAGALAALAPAQEPERAAEPLPPGVAARWDGGEATLEEFEAFLGRTFRRQPLGSEALRHLLQIQLVEREAAARGISAPPAAVAARVAEARSEAKKAGLDLDEILAQRGIRAEEFERLLRDSLLHEALARQDLGRGPDETVTSEELQRWTEEHVAALLEKAREAPPGLALDSPPFTVTEEELGRAIRTALSAERLRPYLLDLLVARIAAAWALEQGVEIGAALLDEELEWQRRRAEEQGVSLDALLQALGSSAAEVRQNPHLRATATLRLMAERRYDTAWFEALPPERRQELGERFGARREVAWILLRAAAQKEGPLDLTYEEAEEELRKLAAGIRTAQDFRAAASQYSEDEVSRLRDGSLGWLHRRDPRADPEVTAAAFAAAPGAVAGPIRTREGAALVLVGAVEPEPDEEAFRGAVRRGLVGELRSELLAEARLRTIYD